MEDDPRWVAEGLLQNLYSLDIGHMMGIKEIAPGITEIVSDVYKFKSKEACISALAEQLRDPEVRHEIAYIAGLVPSRQRPEAGGIDLGDSAGAEQALKGEETRRPFATSGDFTDDNPFDNAEGVYLPQFRAELFGEVAGVHNSDVIDIPLVTIIASANVDPADIAELAAAINRVHLEVGGQPLEIRDGGSGRFLREGVLA